MMGEKRWMVQEEELEEEREGIEKRERENNGDKKLTRKMVNWMKEEMRLKREGVRNVEKIKRG